MTSRGVAVSTQSNAKVSKKQLPFLAVYRAWFLLPENGGKNVYSFRLIFTPFFQNVSTLRHNKKLPEKNIATLITVLSAIFSYLRSLYTLEGNIKLRSARSLYVLCRSCSFYRERATARFWRTRIRNLVSVRDAGARMLRGPGSQMAVAWNCKYLYFWHSKYLKISSKSPHILCKERTSIRIIMSVYLSSRPFFCKSRTQNR
jgi:hypothetical protein